MISTDDSPISKPFWTVKIAGISGSGKTSLLKRIEESSVFKCKTVTYSNLLKEFGGQSLADMELRKILECSEGLVLMDEHLEFDNPNRLSNYLQENTKGLILLDPPLEELIARIENDSSKSRVLEPQKFAQDAEKSRSFAKRLSSELNIPLLIDNNSEGHFDATFDAAIEFLETLYKNA